MVGRDSSGGGRVIWSDGEGGSEIVGTGNSHWGFLNPTRECWGGHFKLLQRSSRKYFHVSERS